MNTLEALQSLKESSKEEEIYFEGPFWIIADSLDDIRKGKFSIDGLKIPCTFDGTILNNTLNRNQQVHKRYWRDVLQQKYSQKDYNYYPRGRVGIYEGNGKAYIFLNSQFNNPFVIDAIVKEYGLEKLDIELELNDITQGSHYDFQLK